MPISVKDLQRIGSFTLSTEKLGEIKIWAFTVGAANRLAEGTLRNEFQTPEEKLKLLIQLIGTRLNHEDEKELGKKFTKRELKKLSNNEIDAFAATFLQKHPYLYSNDVKSQEITSPIDFEKVDFPKQPQESLSAYLSRTLDEYRERSTTKFLKGVSTAIADQFKENSDLSHHIKVLLDEVKIPRRSLTATLSTGVVHSPLQRLDEMVDTLNSLAELNRESVKLVTSLNDLGREMAIEFARNAKHTTRLSHVAIAIALVSLVLTTVFSILNYIQTK